MWISYPLEIGRFAVENEIMKRAHALGRLKLFNLMCLSKGLLFSEALAAMEMFRGVDSEVTLDQCYYFIL